MDHGARHPDMKKSVTDAFILTCNVSLEYEKRSVCITSLVNELLADSHLYCGWLATVTDIHVLYHFPVCTVFSNGYMQPKHFRNCLYCMSVRQVHQEKFTPTQSIEAINKILNHMQRSSCLHFYGIGDPYLSCRVRALYLYSDLQSLKLSTKKTCVVVCHSTPCSSATEPVLSLS